MRYTTAYAVIVRLVVWSYSFESFASSNFCPAKHQNALSSVPKRCWKSDLIFESLQLGCHCIQEDQCRDAKAVKKMLKQHRRLRYELEMSSLKIVVKENPYRLV